MHATRTLASAFLIANALACSPSQESQAASHCRVDIQEWLPRPETAEFLEFSGISQQEYGTIMAGMMIQGFGDDEPGSTRAAFESETRTMARDHAQRMSAKGALFYRYRTRFQDRSGRVDESVSVCAASAAACTCTSRDRIAEMRASRSGR